MRGFMTKRESVDIYSLLINKASCDCTDSRKYKYIRAKKVYGKHINSKLKLIVLEEYSFKILNNSKIKNS